MSDCQQQQCLQYVEGTPVVNDSSSRIHASISMLQYCTSKGKWVKSMGLYVVVFLSVVRYTPPCTIQLKFSPCCSRLSRSVQQLLTSGETTYEVLLFVHSSFIPLMTTTSVGTKGNAAAVGLVCEFGISSVQSIGRGCALCHRCMQSKDRRVFHCIGGDCPESSDGTHKPIRLSFAYH